jgi:beta-mannosidase
MVSPTAWRCWKLATPALHATTWLSGRSSPMHATLCPYHAHPHAHASLTHVRTRTPPLFTFTSGDLITDLHRAGVIPDPYLDLTWMERSSLWANRSWTFSTNFSVSSTGGDVAAGSSLLLVFDGVKMGATVRVNGHVVGFIRDQFLRYTFNVAQALPGLLQRGRGAVNQLDVTIGAGDVAEDGRFMACSGGWDWAPYSYTITNSSGATTGPASTFSKGVWKSVYIVEVPAASAAITHVTPHTRYSGAYPVSPLEDGAHGGFTVNVTAHMWAPPGGSTGSLAVAGSWSGSGESRDAVVSTETMTLPPGPSIISLQLTATAAQIKLWWPAGVGAQPLYNVTATWTATAYTSTAAATTTAAAAASTTTTATRRFGFRVFALVTINDTDAAYVAANASADGTAKHGMFFRVNGAAIYSRGANMVPMEELEGRMDAEAHRILVKSSADAGMNTLRVWGGGVFLPSVFYDACDE